MHTLVSNVSRFINGTILEFCCFGKPFDIIYCLKNAFAWWHELKFEGRQRTNTRGNCHLGWNALEVFALPQRGFEALYAGVPGVWC